MRRIYSLNLAAYLLNHGLRYLSIEQDEDIPDKKYFLFEESEQVEKLVNDYKNNQDLKKFIKSYKELKTLLGKSKSESK